MSDDPTDPGRPTRPCDGCDQVDNHPRHLIDEGARVLMFHYDCVPRYLQQAHPSPAHEAARKGVRGDYLVAVVNKHAARAAKEGS